MKKVLLMALALGFSVAAHADWQKDLQDYRTDIATRSSADLVAYYLGNLTKSVGVCTFSAAGQTTAAAIFDTLPSTNFIAELLANETNPDYQTLNSEGLIANITDWHNYYNAVRSSLGGANIAILEFAHYFERWLSGTQETVTFENLKENYASTYATAEALFAPQGQCNMTYAKELILVTEMKHRLGLF